MSDPRKRIAFSQLLDWVEGRLTEEEARAVEEQVALADASTLADVAWVRRFVRATEASILESPPPDVRSALVARFKAHAEGRRTPVTLWSRQGAEPVRSRRASGPRSPNKPMNAARIGQE
jgi:hypothetical protein